MNDDDGNDDDDDGDDDNSQFQTHYFQNKSLKTK